MFYLADGRLTWRSLLNHLQSIGGVLHKVENKRAIHQPVIVEFNGALFTLKGIDVKGETIILHTNPYKPEYLEY